MASLEDIDPDTERAARAFVAKVARQYELAGAILFGSRARRNHRPDSDADIAVLLHGLRGQFLDTKLALADIAYDVLLETGLLIQPLPVWEDEWAHPESYINPALLRNIRREGVRL
jgi:predicted nucleotidyltransferase